MTLEQLMYILFAKILFFLPFLYQPLASEMMFNLMEENFCAFRWKIICLVPVWREATDCQQHHVNMSMIVDVSA